MLLFRSNWTADQTIYIPGLGSWRINCARYWSELDDPDSYATGRSGAFICPKCLKTWAIRKWERDQITGVCSAWCEQCGPQNEWIDSGHTVPVVPGSLFYGWRVDKPLLMALPRELLEREVRLLFKRMDIEK